MQPIFDAPYLTIVWDNEAALVELRWKAFVAGKDFRDGLERGLQLLVEKQAHRWLADLRDLKTIAQADQQWSNEVWFPKAIKAGMRKMAIVQPKATIAKMSVDAIMSKVPNTELSVGNFEDIADAKAWLAR